MMTENEIKSLCQSIGKVNKCIVNNRCFGNIELDIITANGTRLRIFSDRGEYSCFIVKTGALMEKTIPINKVVGTPNPIIFNSLYEAILYLKNNLSKIEPSV